MLKLMEKLKKNDVTMIWKPSFCYGDSEGIIVTFQKTGKLAIPYQRYWSFSFNELRALNVGIEDLLLDLVDLFLKEFKEKESKQ